MSQVVIFGEGKIAEEVYSYLTNDSPFDVVAFCADGEYIAKETLFGLPAVPFEDILDRYPPDDFKMFVALGYHRLNTLRESKYYEAKGKGYELVSYVCSKASNFGQVVIGDNSLVLEHAAIQPMSKIGSNVFVWSGNHIGHHAEVKDHAYLCGHVVVSGNAVIGERCFVGVNSTIGHNVTVGDDCIIGAGTLILKDASDKSVFIREGTPKFRLPSDYYLQMGSLE